MEESTDKPHLIHLAGGPDLTLEHVLAFCKKLLGRDPTPEELEEMKRTLDFLPEK